MTQPKANKVTLLTALVSVFRAAFGVQKRVNMERDLNAANPLVFVLAAIIFTAAFISSILLVVSWVIP